METNNYYHYTTRQFETFRKLMERELIILRVLHVEFNAIFQFSFARQVLVIFVTVFDVFQIMN